LYEIAGFCYEYYRSQSHLFSEQPVARGEYPFCERPPRRQKKMGETGRCCLTGQRARKCARHEVRIGLRNGLVESDSQYVIGVELPAESISTIALSETPRYGGEKRKGLTLSLVLILFSLKSPGTSYFTIFRSAFRMVFP
jgi:hypothetical protein